MAVQEIQITQAELEEIAEVEREAARLKNRAEELKSNLLPLLREGVPVEPGRFGVRLEKRVGRSIPWKKLVITELGEAAAVRFKKQFKPHIWFEVKVVEYAVQPLWNDSTEGISTDN